MAKLKLMPGDCETGGTDPKKSSLLTLYLCVLDDDFNIVDELDLRLKPNDGKYVVEQEAMDINKINLEEHDKDAVTYEDGAVLLQAFLQKHHTGGRWASLRPAGHNFGFDLSFIFEHLMPKEKWEKYCHYRYMDTTPLCTFFQFIGKWPEKLGRLTDIAQFLGVKMRDAHNAKNDTLMWIDTFKTIVRTEKAALAASGLASTSVSDELVILEL
jgi:oligoribonuclease (3'-5' exoribonuclease)